MSTVHVSYHHERGWAVIDEADYAAPLDEPFTYCVRRVPINDGDALRLRATFEQALPAGQADGLTARAERWLLDRGLARKKDGLLLVDWPAVHTELDRTADERRERV